MDCHSWVNSTLIDVTGIYFSNTVSKKGKLHENKTLIMYIGSTTQYSAWHLHTLSFAKNHLWEVNISANFLKITSCSLWLVLW